MLKRKRLLALFIALALASASAAACSSGDKQPDSTDNTQTTTEPEASNDYPYYGDTDFGGETFTIFNVTKDLWEMLCILDPEEYTGEVVNDAIYARNERVEKQLNCNIEEINDPGDNIYEMPSALAKLILANDDVYDAAYIGMCTTGGGIKEGYYHCLNDIETIHLDESYWDQVVLSSTKLYGKNYFAMSSAHLMGWDSLRCIFFNETMMDNLGLEYPYQLVKDGKWTIDKLQELSHAAASLNGSESFANNDTNNCIYGCTTFNNVISNFLFGFGYDYIKVDESGTPVLSCENEGFISACQKLSSFLSVEGDFLDAEVYDNTLRTHSRSIFMNDRTLFLPYELKTAQAFRSIDSSFGILPFPKLDESQKNYRSTAVNATAMFTIPVTNTNPERVGLLFDALSFESDKSVLPSYFSIMVEQKGLRNEESIEMLNIIKETRSFDFGIAFDLCVELNDAINQAMIKGDDIYASKIASSKQTVQANIDKIVNSSK